MFSAIVAKLARASFLGLALAFVFSTGAMAEPAVYSSGIKVVGAGHCLDFEALVRLACSDPTADIGYTNAGPGTTSKLGPVDSGGHVGAKIKEGNTNKPSFTICANAAVGWNDYARTSIPVGTWFCALTNGNRVARFKVLAISHKSIQLKVTVWSNLD